MTSIKRKISIIFDVSCSIYNQLFYQRKLFRYEKTEWNPDSKKQILYQKRACAVKAEKFPLKTARALSFYAKISPCLLDSLAFSDGVGGAVWQKKFKECLFMVCASFVPLGSPPSPLKPLFHHALLPRFSLFPSSLSPENAQNKNIRLRSPFNKCPNRKFKQHMDQLCAFTDQ